MRRSRTVVNTAIALEMGARPAGVGLRELTLYMVGPKGVGVSRHTAQKILANLVDSGFMRVRSDRDADTETPVRPIPKHTWYTVRRGIGTDGLDKQKLT